MRRDSGRRGVGARPGRRPSIEPLEGRALLSRFGTIGPGDRPPPLPQVGPVTPGEARGDRPDRPVGAHGFHGITDHDPLREHVVEGAAFKHPRFYKGYDGPRLPSLNGEIASARLIPGRGFVFTATMVGPIDPSQPALYTFGVDRGGAVAPGPFPHRASVFFDSNVVVTTGPTGPGASVTLLGADGTPTAQTALPSRDVQISGRTVSVTVDPALLPPTSTPRTRLKLTEYRFTFWASTEAGSPHKIASFVPEYSLAPFQIPRF